MSKLNKFLDQVFLNSRDYPKIDLQDREMVTTQVENIRKFRVRQLRVLVTFSLAMFEIPFVQILGEYFSIDTKTGALVNFALISFFLLVSFLIFFMFRYRCPNCGTQPAGTAISISSGISNTRGIHPFPRRCNCCGYYLSKRSLAHDLIEQKTSAANPESGSISP